MARKRRGLGVLLHAVLAFATGCDDSATIAPDSGGTSAHGGRAGSGATTTSSTTGGHGGSTTSGGGGQGGGGQGGDAECSLPSDCPGEDTGCRDRTCDDHSCGIYIAPEGTPCGHCGGDTCNGEGWCIKTDTCQDETCPWSKGFGDWKLQLGSGLAVDGTGAAIFSGMFDGSVDFGGNTFVSVPPAAWELGDGYVAKLSTTGHHQWSLAFGSDGADSAEAVAVDGASNVVVAGFFEGTVDLGGSALVSIDQEDVLLGKLDASGQHLWSRSLGGAGHQFGRDVAVDPSGNIAVIGHFDGTLDAGGTPLVAAGMQDAFVVKLTPAGTPSWSLRWGGGAHDVGWRVAVDAGGNIFAVGRFEGEVDFGAGLVASAGAHDLFLVKIDPNGQHLFSRRFGGSSEEHVYDLAVDSTGAVIMTGATRGSVDFGGGSLCGAGGSDAFLVKLDSAGSHLWSQCFGTMGDDAGTGVTTDGADNIVLTGVGGGQLDFGGGSVDCQPAPDVAVARFTSAGQHLHSACYGGPTYQLSANVALDPWESILLVGNYRDTLDFGSGELDGCAYDEPDHPEGYDVFVAKLVP